MQLSVVILAAGQGKRMNSDLPKVLQPLAGQPLLQHVIDTARALDPANIYVVYGHGGAQVQAALPHEHVDWMLQAEQLGTGHAVMQAMCVIPDDHTVLVLYGDVPLIRTRLPEETDRRGRRQARWPCCPSRSMTRRGMAASCATPMAASRAIVEHKDASCGAIANSRGQLGTHGGSRRPSARMAAGTGQEQFGSASTT